MQNTYLDGSLFLQMMEGGTRNLSAKAKQIDALNVFPVPDGDTGTNMTRTYRTGFEESRKNPKNNLSETAEDISKGMLLGARGNSGVILSQFFRGIQKGFAGLEKADVNQIVQAWRSGVRQSYKAVVTPVEGTILTVFREATEYAAERINENSTVEDFFKYHVEGAEKILPKTKEMLKELKEADVVDSGGTGYLAIAEGMYLALTDENYLKGIEPAAEQTEIPQTDISAFTRDSELNFGYCTECLLRLQTKKVDPDAFDINVILEFLESEGGQSVVCYKDSDIVKLHVHTPNPGNVLNELRKYGEFLTVKIENMALQHEEKIKKESDSDEEKMPELSVKKKVAVVTVADGKGIIDLFKEMGADEVINGGQTGNPPAQDFVDAFSRINAEHIIVLPNNSNILMTAKQAAKLSGEETITVIPTKSIQQGYCALALVNPLVEEFDSMVNDITDALEEVTSGEVAAAVRDTVNNGIQIKEGDYIGIKEGEIVCAEKNRVTALLSLLKSTDDIRDKELLTIFYGKACTEDDISELQEKIEEEFPDLEMIEYTGYQEVYDFLISLE